MLDVGQVDLDRGQAAQLERVPDRVRVVRPGARVEHQAVDGPGRLVERLAEVALVVGLREGRLEPQLARVAPDDHLEIGEGHARVVLRVAPAQLVEVHPVHHLHAVPHAEQTSSTAALRFDSDTS